MSEVIDIERTHGRGNLAYHLSVRGFQSRTSDTSPRPAATKRGEPSGSPYDSFAANPFPDDLDAAVGFAGSSNGQYAMQQGGINSAAAAAAAAGGSSADSAKRSRH
jgi:hypothetical protein